MHGSEREVGVAMPLSTLPTFKLNCNPFCQMMSDWLSLPRKLVGAGLDSILSHVGSRPQKLRYWFSNRATIAHHEKSLKRSSPSFTSLIAAWARDSETTNSKYAKTVTNQVYPCQELGVIWKKWVSAVRKVYNISIAYLNEHQGFTKIGKSGGKRGLRMVLKTSGLIPQWYIHKRMAGLRIPIQDLRLSECHKQIASDLAKTYFLIGFRTFETSQMVVKKSHKLRSKTASSMMNLADHQISKNLQYLCYLYGSKLVGSTEEYTSKTGRSCGHLYLKLGVSPKFKCPDCGYEISRIARSYGGILLKAWWDKLSIVHAQQARVVLSI
jgi:predicted RNA-binding Zn-ribbon protein involved in translation (DUF1610 family)